MRGVGYFGWGVFGGGLLGEEKERSHVGMWSRSHEKGKRGNKNKSKPP